MVSFKDYLVEAQFDEDDFSRVLGVFERRMPSLLGAKMYRSGGPGHVIKMPGFSHIMYFFGDHAFAIRFKGNHFLGIDVWSKYTFDRGPDFFIDVHTLAAGSIVGSMRKLADLIKNPKEGNFEVPKINESIELSEMAKRVTDDSFYKMAIDAYGESVTRKLTWDQIKKVADDNDVTIPGYVRGQKVGRGVWDLEPGKGGTDKDSDAPKPVKRDGSKDILFIKVTAQDPNTKKFISAGDSSAAQELYSKIAVGLDHKPSEKELRDPETLYGHLAQLVDMASKGTLKSLLIYGGPGTGKCLPGDVNINILTKEDVYAANETQGNPNTAHLA